MKECMQSDKRIVRLIPLKTRATRFTKKYSLEKKSAAIRRAIIEILFESREKYASSSCAEIYVREDYISLTCRPFCRR